MHNSRMFRFLAMVVLFFCYFGITQTHGEGTNEPTTDQILRPILQREVELKQQGARLQDLTRQVWKTNAAGLTSASETDQYAAERWCLDQRKVIIDSLVGAMVQTNSIEVKSHVARVLGEFRAEEGVDCLVKNIQVDVAARLFSSLTTEEQREPVGAALVKIGEAAVTPLLDRIGTEENIYVTDHCLKMVVRIAGKQRTVELVLSHAEAATDSKAKERFKRALSKMQI